MFLLPNYWIIDSYRGQQHKFNYRAELESTIFRGIEHNFSRHTEARSTLYRVREHVLFCKVLIIKAFLVSKVKRNNVKVNKHGMSV